MCGDKKLASECKVCIDDIRKEANVVMIEIKDGFRKEFKETQETMREEWKVFLDTTKESNSVEKKNLEDGIEKKESKSSGIIKWMLSICLAISLVGIGSASYNAGRIASIEAMKADRVELEKYMTVKNSRELYYIVDAYYKQLFILRSGNIPDSTTINWLVKHYLYEPDRSGKLVKK